MTLAEARERLATLLPYLHRQGGGVTASGGEPTLQPDFVRALFKAAQGMGLTTALDTNGSCVPSKRRALLAVTDTVLLDIKASEERLHRRLTGRSLAPTLEFGRLAAQVPGRLVIRRVLLQGINDSAVELDRLAAYARDLPNRPVIELIPYHRLGEYKWKELGIRYPLAGAKAPEPAVWRRAAARFEKAGLTVRRG